MKRRWRDQLSAVKLGPPPEKWLRINDTKYARDNLGLTRYRIHHHDNYREMVFQLEKA